MFDHSIAAESQPGPSRVQQLRRRLLSLGAIIIASAVALSAAVAQPWADWYRDYKDYDEIVMRASALADARPDLVERVHIGTTYLGEEIFGLRVTDLAGGIKPGVLLNAAQHGNETFTPLTALYAIEWLLRNHDESREIEHILNEFEFIVTPVFNVDGYLARDRHNARNIDLNRNWSIGFVPDKYHGPKPFSEPETQAMRDFILAHPNLIAHIDIHQAGGMVLEPWSYTFDYPEDHVLLHYVGQLQADAMNALHGRRFRADIAPRILYVAEGTFHDWTYGAAGCVSYAYELSFDDAPKGKDRLWCCQETFAGIMTFTQWLLERPMIVGDFDGLSAGREARIDVVDGSPQTTTWLVYSLVGEGSTYVPALNVSLGLELPRLAGPSLQTDEVGFASWVFTLPGRTPELPVWFQAAQFENVSNVDLQMIDN